MAERMLQFVRLSQQTPDKRAVPVRREDFAEIYNKFDPARAAEQASRCSQCGVPFCSVHCPLSNNIPDWLKLTAEGRLEEAYEVSSATNNFPEICGRICPQDRLCEGNCVIEKGFESVTIGAVERYITDTAFASGWIKPIAPKHERTQSVGIIGAGPGGLAAADMLRTRGYQVHVYDRYDRVGGLMIYGIPGFKLEKEIVLRRWKLLEEGGGPIPSRPGHWRGAGFRGIARHARCAADRHRRLQAARDRRAGRRAGRDRSGAGLPDRVQPYRAGRRGAGIRQRGDECGRQAGGGDRRRRYRDGLRADGRAAGGDLRAVPVSPRPGQHAWLHARGEEMRRKRVSSSSGCLRPRRSWAMTR